MIIKSITLTNFRNHAHYSLEAIYILTRGKSFRATDVDILKRNTPFYRIELKYTNGLTTAAVYDGKQKTFITTDKKTRRLPSQAKYPVILFLPSDLNLISHSPSRRREYFDRIFSQLDEDYNNSLTKYNKALKQRNELLKDASPHKDSLFSWNLLLAQYGINLYKKRQEFIQQTNSKLTPTYQSIAENDDIVDLVYDTMANHYTTDIYLHTLEQSLDRDIYLGHTTFGIHRDDYLFNFNHQSADKSASRGETRSIILALKFIEAELIKQRLSQCPVVLLDDVFSELDETRRRCLVKNFKDNQVIITSVEYIKNNPQ